MNYPLDCGGTAARRRIRAEARTGLYLLALPEPPVAGVAERTLRKNPPHSIAGLFSGAGVERGRERTRTEPSGPYHLGPAGARYARTSGRRAEYVQGDLVA